METATAVQIDEQKVTSLVTTANAITIKDQATYNRAIECLQAIKGLRSEMKTSYKDKVVAKAYEAYKSALKFFTDNDGPLELAENRVKGLVLTFDRAKKAEEDRKQREADEKARREAQEKANAEAARLKKIADDHAAELKAQADREAEEKRKQAERDAKAAQKSGASKKEVEEIKKEGERAADAVRKEAATTIQEVKGSTEQQIAEVRASAEYVPPVQVKESYTRAAAVTTGKNWDGEVTDLSRLLVHIVVGRDVPGVAKLAHPELLTFIEVRQKGVRDLAKAQEEHFNVPGARAFDKGRVAASKF